MEFTFSLSPEGQRVGGFSHLGYRKAGVTGRNELAAWFFEDMLEAPPLDGN